MSSDAGLIEACETSAGEGRRPLRALERLLAWSATLGIIAIWLIVLMITWDVIARAAGSPTIWVGEISAYLMAALALVAAGDTLRIDGHFRVALVVERLPPPLRRAVLLAVDVVSLAFVLGFAWGGWQIASRSFRYGISSPTLLQFPLYLTHSLLWIGGLALALALLLRIVGELGIGTRRQ
jgi:TRAP-type C4-dicarboxylate transport system permease small subunit